MSQLAKFRSLILPALLVLVLVASACSAPTSSQKPVTSGDSGSAGESSSEAAPAKLKFSYFPALHTMVVFVADQGGFFEEENLDVEMVYTNSGGLQPAMVISGEVDAATVDLVDVTAAYAQGKELLHIFPTVNRMSMNLVVRNEKLEELGLSPDDPLEKRLQALGQMTLGFTTPNAPTDQFTRYYLRKAGYDPEKANLVSIGSASNLIAALKTGQIDAFQLTPPSPNVPEIEGFGTILIKSSAGDVPEFDNYPYTGVSVRKEWAEQNSDVLVRFVRALIKASRFAQENPEKTKEYLKAYFEEMDDAMLEAGMKDMLPALPKDGRMSEEFVANYLQLNKDLGILEVDELPSFEEGGIWTNKYVDEALKSLGGS